MDTVTTVREQDQSFRTCSCGQGWATRESFLEDRATKVLGYQVDFDEVGLGLFLFNHLTCGTTISFQVQRFLDLYDGPVYSAPLQHSGKCPEYCMHKEELRPCTEECECAFVRDILHMIREWPKHDRE